MFCGVALNKITQENGATEVIPGSWAWDDERKPDQSEVTYVEMDIVPSLLISLWCPGIYRTEENQFLAVPHEVFKKYPEDVQDVLGWRSSIPYLGWHEFSHPFNLFLTGARSRVVGGVFCVSSGDRQDLAGAKRTLKRETMARQAV
ncbi:hypothetical protein LTR17_022450 [Elasticomyces elasticus]|nr:hypothetical protein LTR17_022450 [Elasticomyces elasticus]